MCLSTKYENNKLKEVWEWWVIAMTKPNHISIKSLLFNLHKSLVCQISLSHNYIHEWVEFGGRGTILIGQPGWFAVEPKGHLFPLKLCKSLESNYSFEWKWVFKKK